ncbi:MAG: hypothetical protein WAK93_13625 [Solirubrobacteraceae bacterium]
MEQLKVLALLLTHLLMTGLPGAAAVLIAARRRVTHIPLLLAIGLAASGATAMLGFWLYYAAPIIGKTFSVFVLVGSVWIVAVSIRGRRIDRSLTRPLATPLVLWMLGSSFLVFLGFLHGGSGASIVTSATRFTGFRLPSDNDIPQFFATWFYTHGHNGIPPVYPGDWLASDRPPLQIGYVMMQRPLGWDNSGLNYELVAVALQQLWIIGLWALLVAARVGRMTRLLAMLSVLVSDLAIVNGFFVWPKMLPAAMLLAAAALMITPAWSDVRRQPAAGVLIGLLLVLAMLGHGSSVFGIVPLALIAAVRGLPSWRWLALAVAVGVLLYVPWSSYQKYGDPPGNRLTKWALAGTVTPDGHSTSTDIVDAYRHAGVGGTLHNKAENFVVISGGGPMVSDLKSAVDAAESGDLATAVVDIRGILFFDLLPSFGLLLIVPVLMLVARSRRALSGPEWRFALTCYSVVSLGAIIEGLVLFGNVPSQAVIHEGSYMLPVLGFCAAVAGARAAFPRFAGYLVGVSALVSVAIYAPVLNPSPGTGYEPIAIAVAAASLAAFGLVALRSQSEPATGPQPTTVELVTAKSGQLHQT